MPRYKILQKPDGLTYWTYRGSIEARTNRDQGDMVISMLYPNRRGATVYANKPRGRDREITIRTWGADNRAYFDRVKLIRQ